MTPLSSIELADLVDSPVESCRNMFMQPTLVLLRIARDRRCHAANVVSVSISVGCSVGCNCIKKFA